MKSQLTVFLFLVSLVSYGQLYAPNGTVQSVTNGSSTHVGIGTPIPADQLEIVNGNRKVGFNAVIPGVSNGGMISLSRPDDGFKTMLIGPSAAPADDNVIFSQGGNTEMRLVSYGGPYASAGFAFYNNISVQAAFGSARPTPVMKIDGFGNVGIGTINMGSYKLAVEGKIGAREINVTLASWSDYVFEKDYKLPTLDEVKTYIDQHKHLPDVPSAEEVKANGINVGEMNAILLKKIEELTLYMIEQQQEIKNLRVELEGLKK